MAEDSTSRLEAIIDSFIQTLPDEMQMAARKMDEIITIVEAMVGIEAVMLWVDTPIPSLGNRIPFDMLMPPDLDVLLAYVRTYLDPSVHT